MKKIYQALKAIFHRHRLEQDLQDEIESHLKMDTRERIEAGESPSEAQRNARRDFGGTLRYAEDVRDSWDVAGIDRLAQDVRYALRQLQRNPAFAIAAILTLGLGIGANTAIFSIVNTILLKPLPYKNSDRLVRIVENVPASESFSGTPERTTGMSPSSFMEWRSKTKTLSAMAMERHISKTVFGREPVRLSGLQVSPALFSMLSVQPMLGRTFEETEENAGSDQVVILSYGIWVNQFGADPKLLGRPITLDDTKYTIIGVMPREFIYPDAQTSFWTPLALPLPNVLGLPVIARLKDGVPISAAAEEATNITREFRGESPNDPQPPGPPRIRLMSVKDELVEPIRLPFLVFVIAVTFVLLIACVNVANLFLARTTTRRMEIAIRMALGANRRRVLRQLSTENFILALLGGVTGVGVAFAGSRVFVALGQSLARTDLKRFELAGNAIPRLNEVTIDASVLLFALALTVATGLLFGIIPALQIRRRNPIQFVNSRLGVASSASVRLIRNVMVIAQIAFTMILLLAAGLLIKSFVKLANTNLGYDSTNVLTFKIPQPELDYPRDRPKQFQQNAFAEDVVRRVASISGVEAAAFTNELPMVQGFFGWQGSNVPDSRNREGRIGAISHDYFRAMRVPVVAGRAFTSDDRRSKRPVYIINETAARESFAGVNPIGKTISGAGFPLGEIVGIVDDIRQSGLEAEPVPQLFMHPDHMDAVWGEGYYFVVRTTNDLSIVPAIRSIVSGLDAKAIVDNVATMDEILSNSITTPRSYAVLLASFSVAALVLALIGLYGLLAYLVRERSQEIGVRIALGAHKHQILLLVLRQGIGLSLAGIAVGIAGGVALTKYLQKMLFGVSTVDPSTFVVVSVLFMVVAILAAYIPARQAAVTDPLRSLRFE